MYLDYLEKRAALIGLALAVLAVAVAASIDDLRSGSALIAVAFLFGSPFVQARRAWLRRSDPERWIQVGFPLVFVLVCGVDLLWSAKTAQGGFDRLWSSLQWIGAAIGVMLLAYFFVHYLPRQAEKQKKCPDCTTIVPSEARVCRACQFRWPDELD